jgi:drug/metabolite transporter (DMT)-like permease
MRSERLRVWLGFLVVSTVWGSTWLAIKIGLGSVPPFLGAGVRFTVASLLLWLILRLRRESIPWSPATRKIYLSMGILSFTVPFALVYWAQQFIPSGLGSILFGAFPLCVALFSRIMLPGERLGPWKAAGIVLGFAGVALIFSDDLYVHDPQALLGISAILLSVILQAYVLILVKREAHEISSFALNFMGMAIAMVFLLALSGVAERSHPVHWDGVAFGSIAYLSVMGSVLTFVTYYWLLKRVDPVYLSLTSFINPVVAMGLGALVLGEGLAPVVAGGSTLVLLGILVANGKSLYAKLHPVH